MVLREAQYKMKLHWKIWLLIIVLIAAILSIAPWAMFEKGVMISSIEKNSTEALQGLSAGMIIKEINGNQITNEQDYLKITSDIFSENGTKKITIKTSDSEFIFLTEGLQLIVKGIPKTHLKTGLDLSGGARALIKPSNVTLTDSELNDLIAITSERFNVYGLKDITIKPVKDLQGTNYMLIEIAGATPTDLRSLVSSQGKFEAKIANQTVFVGGKDIAHVERSGQFTGIRSCSQDNSGGETCSFSFPISLTAEAAKRHAEITSKLSVSLENPGYLSEKLDFYIDDNLVDSLLISQDLKGRETTQ